MDTKILYHLATIGMSKFDLLAYRYGFLTTSTFVEGELRLCAFDQNSPDCTNIVCEIAHIDDCVNENELKEWIDCAINKLKEGMMQILQYRAGVIHDQIESLKNR